jgi:ribosomal-protein-alanine N-acetyltransferase
MPLPTALQVETDRLSLRPFSADGIDALLGGDGARADDLTGARFPRPLRPPPLMEKVLPLVRDQLRRSPETLGWWTWLAIDREGGTVTGALGFGGPPDGEGSVMIGYATYPGSEHRGLATEASEGLIRWALAQPGVTRVCASIPEDNLAARRVAEKIGMRVTASVWEEEIDDVLLYEIRRDREW